jgi:hypothetical protein
MILYLYRWFIPFTYFVQEINNHSPKHSEIELNPIEHELHHNIIWISPEDEESIITT